MWPYPGSSPEKVVSFCKLRRDFLPRNLPPEMSEALHAAVRGGKVPVFPPRIDVLRGKDKGVTHSVGLQKSLH